MPDGREPTQVRVLAAIGEVDAATWDACAGPGDPFVSHAFLSALEDSGSAVAATGWLPRHLVIEDAEGRPAACAPLYLKNHSYGEYVFDWGWADAYARAGGRYYPKLQCAVPFTPVTGRRLLTRPDLDAETARDLGTTLAGAMVEVARQSGASSVHVTFPTEPDFELLTGAGMLARTGQQFHWENRGYRSFDDFLNELTSRKRKAIKRERRDVEASGVKIRALSGDDIRPEHWDAFYQFYLNTSDRKWGNAYLTRAFFDLLQDRLRELTVLMLAEADGRPVGGALNFLGGDTLYGRYWGSAEAFKFLHFEACYYRAIDYAIARDLKWVEAGAQGPHKIQRGYLPRQTYSAHWIADPALRRAVADFLDDERRHVAFEMRALEADSPFRKD